MENNIRSVLYGKNSEIIMVSISFATVRDWVRKYEAEQVHINKSSDGSGYTLSILYWNKLLSTSHFQKIGDLMELLFKWRTIEKGASSVEFYVDNELICTTRKQLAEWWERSRYAGYLSENPY